MSTPLPPSSLSVGRYTGLVLGLVVFVCLVMIGGAGYLKYQLDQAETILSAPDGTFSPDDDATDKLRRSLGYGGFLGLAQNYVATHDVATLTDMKAEIKNADDMLSHMPEKTTAEVRRDLQSIVATFDNVMQKASKASTDPTVSFTANDLLPLYGALPVLDSRLASAAASDRLAAHNHLQFWAMLLTLISWASLIIAAAMSVGIYLSLRDRNSAPLRALAQSIKNMASGDMRTSIWGIERTDMVGELARAADLARYHFSQLPDMSLLSEQGPVRMRFEGKTRSIFEAMIQVITRDSENVRNQATSLTDAITRQQEAITLISSRVEAVLHNVEKRGLDGDQQIRHVVQSLSTSAQALKNAQEHSADQLNRIVPYLQERAQGIAEIAQITGKQIASALQSLTLTERTLKSSAEQSDAAIKKLSTTADDLGSRMFGAVNLLQASGKVLAETTEKTQSHLSEALEKLDQNIASVASSMITKAPLAIGEVTDEVKLVPRLELIINNFENIQQKLEERFTHQTEAAEAQINMLTTQSHDILTQTTMAAQTLSSIADHMRDEQSRFDFIVDVISAKLEAITTYLEVPPAEHAAIADYTQQFDAGFSDLKGQIAHVIDAVRAISDARHNDTMIKQLGEQISHIADAVTSSKNAQQTNPKLDHLAEQVNGLTDTIANAATAASQIAALPEKVLSEIKNGFDATTKTTQILQDQFIQMSQSLASHTNPDLTDILEHRFNGTMKLLEQLQNQVGTLVMRSEELKAMEPSQHLVKEVEARWFQMAAQIESSRNDLAQAIVQQIDRLEMRLSKSSVHDTSDTTASTTQKQIEQQTQILTELVSTLGVLDAHMQQLKTEMRVIQRLA